MSMGGAIFSVLSVIFRSLLESRRRVEDRKARWSGEFAAASRNLCLSLSDGREYINMVFDSVNRKLEENHYLEDLECLRDCTKLISAFNQAKTVFLDVLNDVYLVDEDYVEFNDNKAIIERSLDSYAEEIQDAYLIIKLACGINASPTEVNSYLQKEILSVFHEDNAAFSPKDVREIILLRFRDDVLTDYYASVSQACNWIAEVADLSLKRDYQILSTPVKAGFGSPEHQYSLALHFFDLGNKQEGIRWLRKASNKGHRESQKELSHRLLASGRRDEGVSLLKQLADSGDEDSIVELGHDYLSHNDYNAAIEYFSRLSSRRRDACFFLAKSYNLKGEIKKALDLYAELTGPRGSSLDIYSAASFYHICDFCYTQMVEDVSFDEQLELFERIEREITNCDDVLMTQYLEELIPFQKARLLILQHRCEEAASVLMSLVQKNFAAAKCLLGLMYVTGEGIPMDSQFGEKLINLSKSQGDLDATVISAVGLIVDNGRNVITLSSLKICFNYLRTACNHGNRMAHERMVWLYSLGLPALIGEGEKGDGRYYEKIYHSSAVSYYYVSLLDKRVYKSTRIGGFVDSELFDYHNPNYWWFHEPNLPNNNLIEKARSAPQKCATEGSYIVIEPDAGIMRIDGGANQLIRVLSGKLKVYVHDQNGELLRCIIVCHSDEIKRVYGYGGSQYFCIEAMQDDTVLGHYRVR